MNAFLLPTTPTCKIIYFRNGVKYSGVIDTPSDEEEFLSVLTDRKIHPDQVEKVEPIQPRGDLLWGNPAEGQIEQYLRYRD